jgi:hypothetical protein
MTAFEKWWVVLVQRKPGLANESDNIIMTVGQLRENLKRSYDAGWMKANEERRSLEINGPFGNIFSVFGGSS